MMPSCDQIGVPLHFHSSTTSGSASLMSLRILLRAFPRQSPSSAIRFEMSSAADWPWLASDFFMFSPHLVSQGGLRERSGRGVILERGPSPSAAVGEPLAIFHHEVDVMQACRHRRSGERLELFRVPMDLR